MFRKLANPCFIVYTKVCADTFTGRQTNTVESSESYLRASQMKYHNITYALLLACCLVNLRLVSKPFFSFTWTLKKTTKRLIDAEKNDNTPLKRGYKHILERSTSFFYQFPLLEKARRQEDGKKKIDKHGVPFGLSARTDTLAAIYSN